MRRLTWLALALLAGSCSSVTEIVLVVDTDIAAADTFRVTAVHPDGHSDQSMANLTTKAPPRTLVLLRRSGPLGPVHLTVEALSEGRSVVSVAREVAFEEGRSLRLDVFLPEGCRTAGCVSSQTCGNDGTCRSPIVPTCEYDGTCVDADGGARDAGSPDSGEADGGDGGVCPLASDSICGVSDTLLVGDVVTPRACASDEAIVSVDGPSGPVDGGGTFLLPAPGRYTVRAAIGDIAGCAITRDVDVAALAPTADSMSVSSGELRDLAARVDTAFVVGRDGAWAVDVTAWFPMAGLGVPTDLRAVAVDHGQPLLGPTASDGAVYRLRADPPFDAVGVTRMMLPAGSREVRALAVPLDATGPALAATKDGLVTVAFDGATMQVGPSWDPNVGGGAAIGHEVAGSYGAIWMTSATTIVNRSISGASAFAGGMEADLPSWLQNAHAVAVDERDASAPRLWVCGDGGAAVWTLTGDWTSRTVLPDPAHTWNGTCLDLALGDEGDAWVASGTSGLVRLHYDAALRARYDAAEGLPGGASLDFVAFAADAGHRQVWALDVAARTIFQWSADALP